MSSGQGEIESPPVTGRVVKLHFACRAELPIGSSLRVTGANLWAPGAVHDALQRQGNAGPSAGAGHSDAAGGSGRSFHGGGSGTSTPRFYGGGPSAASSTASLIGGTEHSNDVSVYYNHAAATDQFASPVIVEDAMLAHGGDHWYTSSVEMVTSPDTYPLWVTKRPVIVILHDDAMARVAAEEAADDQDSGEEFVDASESAPMDDQPPSVNLIQHHRYRYMVVTPGAETLPLDDLQDEIKAERRSVGGAEGVGTYTSVGQDYLETSRSHELDDPSAFGAATTDGVHDGQAVMLWEDPWTDSNAGAHNASQSFSSLPPVRSGSVTAALGTGQTPYHGRRSLAELPYRTLDINRLTGKPADDPTSDALSEEAFTADGVRIDSWNDSEDPSFRPFVIREAISKQQASTVEREEPPLSEMPVDAPPSKQRIYFVCFHLPVQVRKDPATGEWTATWNESLLAKTEGSGVVKNYEANWVGTVTSRDPPIATAEDRDAVRSVLAKMNCTPLFIEPDVHEAHYYGMCKQVLWPAFHNIDLLDMSSSGWMSGGFDKPNPGSEDSPSFSLASDWDQSHRLGAWWEAYTAVNRTFADAMSSVLEVGDIMWVHDYHLCLLPQMQDDAEYTTYGRAVTKKVFFLHIPFPTSQIFRELECGDAILEGILHADVLGFHAFDHARHFLNASKRILGLQYESLAGGLIGVHYRGKTVLVSMHNVSIEPGPLSTKLALPSVADGANMLKQKFRHRSVIAGVDTAQRLSGVTLKLLAYERFLTDYPVWQQKVVLVQKCLLPASRKSDEASTVLELRRLVRRIHDSFGRNAVDYEEISGSSLPVEQRLSLWLTADILMATPVREGLNLLPLEYLFARKDPDILPGVTIASEFSVVCSIMNGALRVNPFDIQSTAMCIDKALTMEMQEREGRRARDIDFVSTSPSAKWTMNVLRDLGDKTMEEIAKREELAAQENRSSHHTKKEEPNSIAASLVRERELAFFHLEPDHVVQAYNSSSRRVIIMDFNGTIVIKEPPGKYLKREILGTSGNKPPTAVHKALELLCTDPRNTVYVVSGDSQENLEGAVGGIVGLGLAASNGARFSRTYTGMESERKWESMDLGVDWEAVKRAALPVMSKYTARTNGSFVKLTHSSIGWSYYSCDPEWGSLQASHLVLELEEALKAFDVRYVMIKGIVEILPRRLNKGLIVKNVLREVHSTHRDVDFILCMGDDISDEKMFTAVFSFVAESGMDRARSLTSAPSGNVPMFPPSTGDTVMQESKATQEDDQMFVFTAAVGKKPSYASCYVNDATDVADLLIRLSGGSIQRGRSMSWDAVERGADYFS